MCVWKGMSHTRRNTHHTMSSASGNGMDQSTTSIFSGECWGSSTCSMEVIFPQLDPLTIYFYIGDADCFKAMVYSEDLEMPPDQDLQRDYLEKGGEKLITVCKHGRKMDIRSGIVELCPKCEKVYDSSRPEKIPYNIKILLLKKQIKCARIDLE